MMVVSEAFAKGDRRMDSYPLAALIAAPIIAAFTIFVLLPRIKKHEEQQEEGKKTKKRKMDE